jgi:polygalacturonase
MRSVAAVVLALIILVPAALADNAANPQAIEQLKSGARSDANAAWWGYKADDATDALQAAIDSGAKTVLVPYTGWPWIVRPIKLRSNLEMNFEPGVVVLAKEGEFLGKGDSLFTAADATDIVLRGYGATLRMRKKDYQNPPYAKAEWRMGIDIVGCERVRVEGLRIESSGGDGIYVGATGNKPYSKDITIRDVVCHDNHRQGISVITAENLLIENCVLSATDGTAPQAGIDFEPNKADERLVNCVMRNCVVEGNTGPNILFYLRPLSREGLPISITVDNCVVRGGSQSGITVAGLEDDAPQGSIDFKNCVVENPAREGIHVSDKAATSARVRFTNCSVSNAWPNAPRDENAPRVPILLDGGRKDSTTAPGGIDFIDCHVYDNAARPVLAYKGDAPLSDVTGTVTVHNPNATATAESLGAGLKIAPGI